jgi:chemotaxis protein MotB
MITLLLAFFIVMYSMSQLDAKKFGKMAGALNGILHGGTSVFNKYGGDKLGLGHGIMKLGDLRTIQEVIEKRTARLGREGDLDTELTERGLVVHIVESALFSESSADLKPKAMELLDLMAERVVNIPNHVRIEGHTDDRPIQTDRYPTNWELSSARATEVVRYFIDNHEVAASRMSALGYGEFRPVRPNSSIENRAINRRVDVVILTMELSLKEPTAELYDMSQVEQVFPRSLEILSVTE